MEEFIPILAIGGFFTTVVLLRQFTSKERMLMIEKGADPAQFKGLTKSIALVLGALAIGAGVGLLFANVLESAFDMDEVVYPAMLFIFGGSGLIVGRKMANREE